MTPPSPMKRTHGSHESSFLHSLASIHLDSSRNLSRSRRHSTNDDVSGSNRGIQPNKTRAARPRVPPRRATVSGLAPDMSLRRAVRSVTPTGEKETIVIHGILKTHCDDKEPITPSQNRVSLSRHEDGTINRRVSSYTVDSTPHDTSSRNPYFSPQCVSVSRPCHTHCNISSVYQSSNMVHLPFPVASAPSSRSRPVRRQSALEIEQLEARRVSSPASVVPPPPIPRRRRSEDPDYDKVRQHDNLVTYCGSRPDYTLGEAARSPSHMSIETCSRAAAKKVSQLKNYDFAFIKRTDGSWTYAILAHRSHDSDGECTMFVMNKEGSTKMIKQGQWAEYVRLVVVDGHQSSEEGPNQLLPRNVSVDLDDEDCSMITFDCSF